MPAVYMQVGLSNSFGESVIRKTSIFFCSNKLPTSWQEVPEKHRTFPREKENKFLKLKKSLIRHQDRLKYIPYQWLANIKTNQWLIRTNF